jgi:hypothetical protein
MIFDKVHLLFRIRIRIHNLKLRIRIRILQKVSDPYGSGSTTLVGTVVRRSSSRITRIMQLKYTIYYSSSLEPDTMALSRHNQRKWETVKTERATSEAD